jgi:hypothetical protein
MSDLLKINRNGQILEIALDRPKANEFDVEPKALRGQLADPCFEIIPLKGIRKKVERTQAYEIRRQ